MQGRFKRRRKVKEGVGVIDYKVLGIVGRVSVCRRNIALLKGVQFSLVSIEG